MTEKIVSYYGATNDTANTESDRLFIGISNSELVCMVKNVKSHKITALEWFQTETEGADWSDIFFELRTRSQLLHKPYTETHCYYHVEEAVMIPGAKFSMSAAEDYLALLFGESNRHDIRHEAVTEDNSVVNAYRIKKSIHDVIGRQFILYQPHHAYTKMLSGLLQYPPAGVFVKIQLYRHHFAVVILKDGILQLVQTFRHLVPEDILYHVLNLRKQFQLADAASSCLEISGRIEEGSLLMQQLNKLFAQVIITTIPEEEAAAFTHDTLPLHYFTPFYSLTV